jgi:hypothetical protein
MSKPDRDDLIAEIDNTARILLRKIGGDSNLTKDQSIILGEQVKAFGEILKWAAIRKDLLPKVENKANTFTLIKDRFHENAASRTPRSRRSAGAPSPEAGAGPVTSAPGHSEDDGDDE